MLTVLRLGHRVHRDFRITTHCGLVARAFGATKMWITGDYDKKLISNLREVVLRFGGPFDVDYIKDWKNLIKSHKESKGVIVHLTMYGQRLLSALNDIRDYLDQTPILIIIGAGKVPGEIYGQADFNISVTNQPHSEISALAVFLDRLHEGKELDKTFNNSQTKIHPSIRSKHVEHLNPPHNDRNSS